MALAVETAALTEQYRQAQLQIQRQTLRDFLVLWPLWNGDAASFANLIQATNPLVQTYRSISASLAGVFYTSFRAAEDVTGQPTVQLSPTVPIDQLAASMYSTGQSTVKQALSTGRTAEQARKVALVRTSGAVTRHVLNGGRDTVLQSAQADKQSLGWARVTDGNPCAFCALLASRGAVYWDESTADFQAHDHCGCQAIPVYRGTAVPANVKALKALYDRSQADAEASGELKPGENPSKDRIRVFRRAYDAQNAAAAA